MFIIAENVENLCRLNVKMNFSNGDLFMRGYLCENILQFCS
jgi:hypothetical protein